MKTGWCSRTAQACTCTRQLQGWVAAGFRLEAGGGRHATLPWGRARELALFTLQLVIQLSCGTVRPERPKECARAWFLFGERLWVNSARIPPGSVGPGQTPDLSNLHRRPRPLSVAAADHLPDSPRAVLPRPRLRPPWSARRGEQMLSGVRVWQQSRLAPVPASLSLGCTPEHPGAEASLGKFGDNSVSRPQYVVWDK